MRSRFGCGIKIPNTATSSILFVFLNKVEDKSYSLIKGKILDLDFELGIVRERFHLRMDKVLTSNKIDSRAATSINCSLTAGMYLFGARIRGTGQISRTEVVTPRTSKYGVHIFLCCLDIGSVNMAIVEFHITEKDHIIQAQDH